MQTKPRRLAAKIVTGVLFSLLIASFALWGIGDIFRGSSGDSAVVQVGDQEVGAQEFASIFQREFNRVRQQIGDLDMETARQLGLVDQIVRQTVTRLLFDQKARDMGLRVGDEQVVQRLRQQSAFQTAGTFNRQVFQETLRRNGLTEQGYVDLLRSDINREHLAFAVTDGLQVPAGLARSLYAYRNEERVAEYVTVRHDAFEIAEPDDSALRDFYDANKQRFMAPEYREVSLVQLKAEDLLDEVSVSEDALHEAYDARQGEFGEPERRHVRQIVFDEKAQAERAVAMVTEGRTLDAVAKKLSGRAAVDLGLNTRDDMLPALADPAFRLKEGAISDPIKSALGWHVIQVTEVQPGRTSDFEDVRDKLRHDLALEKAVDSLVQIANNLDDALAGGASLEDAADTLGLDVRHIEQISREGQAPDGEAIENLPEKSAFLSALFETQQGQQSLLQETSKGGYFVLRVDSVTPEAVRPFDEVRNRALTEYTSDRRAEQAQTTAEEMAKAIDDGTALADLAKERGLEISTTEALKRSDNRQPSAAGRAIAGKLFEVAPGHAVTVGVQDGDIVARLTEVRKAKPEDDQDGVASLREETGQGLRSDVLAQFAAALRDSYNVQVNQTLLDQILSRY